MTAPGAPANSSCAGGSVQDMSPKSLLGKFEESAASSGGLKGGEDVDVDVGGRGGRGGTLITGPSTPDALSECANVSGACRVAVREVLFGAARAPG